MVVLVWVVLVWVWVRVWVGGLNMKEEYGTKYGSGITSGS